MPRRDWSGEWFRLMHERGEPAHIHFAQADSQGSLCWIEVPHWEYDGVGAFTTLMRQRGYQPQMPVLSKDRHSNPWRSFCGLLRYLRFIPVMSARWKRVVPEGVQSNKTIARSSRILSCEETRRLVDFARSKNLSMTALLLWALAESLRSELVPGSGRAYWMVPVNLRGAVRSISDTANQSSCVWVDTSNEPTPQQIARQMQQCFTKSVHWGVWHGLNIGRLVGRRGMKKIVARLDKVCDGWVGVLSNLGVWKEVSAPWSFAPPATKGIPLAAGCVTVHGQMSLTLVAHASLRADEALLQDWLNRWLKKLNDASQAHRAGISG